MNEYVKTWTMYKVQTEVKHEKELGVEYCPPPIQLRTVTNSMYIDYLKDVAKNDGRSLTWHINKAIEMYIQTLGDEK